MANLLPFANRWNEFPRIVDGAVRDPTGRSGLRNRNTQDAPQIKVRVRASPFDVSKVFVRKDLARSICDPSVGEIGSRPKLKPKPLLASARAAYPNDSR